MKIRFLILFLLPMLALSAFASPVKSDSAAKSFVFSDDISSPNPYVTSGLVAMWDAEWNVGFNAHDPESPVWVDLVGSNHMVLNSASTWGENCLVNAPNTKGAIAQYWADGAVTIECVMRVKRTYPNDNIVFVVYNNYSVNTYRGIGKRYNWLTNGVKKAFVSFQFSRTDIFQASFWFDSWSNLSCFLDSEPMPLTRITSATHTTDENAVYLNAGNSEVEYYTIRLYNRELSDAERLLNYDLDRLRFNLP